MINDLDSSLAALFDDAVAPGDLRNADVAFQTPDKDYRPSQATLNLFLHEMTENRSLRDEARVMTRTGNRYTSRMPSLRVDCTYLITAWSVLSGGLKTAEEHRLLGLALLWLGRFPVLDERFLRGSLSAPPQPYPLPVALARTQEGRSNAEFWNALGIAPRPAFALTVTISIDPYDDVEDVPALEEDGVRIRPTSVVDPLLSGRVVDRAADPVPGAVVTVLETGDSVTADRHGDFVVPGPGFGTYTLQVERDGSPPQDVRVTYGAEHQTHTVVISGP
ncbi:Carboxypeptidase regulatory-like domain-containing protein [Modestobacter sp. DSM 44400]|uniref:Pvc16 family protein n=1 Tax=Modestobacter sp. DSM 44400 TaxID=1550230 RepID=UPI00089C0827|nr:Pvc16 family protein [Modestobacter sp. DSM 44400]SDY48209.1 Carboxypeptidase regulatory-like domain-containing protein [Modestobacter sp. DSM 44400]